MADRFNFRIWDKENKKMVYPDGNGYFQLEYDTVITGNGELLNLVNQETIDNCILMQSTGLVDKNGKEIFEGDIIEFSTFKVVVKWEDCRFKIKSSCCDLALDIIRAEKCEVLGNIYENKELLGGNENESKNNYF